MRKINIAIVVLLIVVFTYPLVQAQENKELWAASTYIQSAKIHYQHVYKKSRLREDLYHCIDLLKEGADRFGHVPQFYYMIGTFYAEINAIDTVVAYYDSVAAFCEDESIDKKHRKNCYKKENYIKKMKKQRLDFWEKSYNSAIEYIGQYDQVTDMRANSPEDSISIYDSLTNKAFDLAMSDFKMALTAQPGDTTTLIGMAALYQRQNMHKEAIDLYYQIKDIKGEDGDIVNRIAYAHISLEDWENSRDWFLKLEGYIPDDINTLVNLSVIFNRLGDYDKWNEYIEKVLALEPENKQFLFNGGQYWFIKMQEVATNDTTLAKEYMLNAKGKFEKLIEIDPNDTDGLKQLGILNLLNAQPEEAIAPLEKYMELMPFDQDVMDFLSRAYIMTENWDKAITVYEKMVENDSGNTDAWERLCELYGFNKMQDKADEACARVEELKKL
ncbi:MAG: hypothetical protein V3V99_03000 [candidate division Zixibacteria bacterium]